ncbi:long-chain fatty acid--CoA ligase [Pseudonocardia sp. KRD-184]|uniref:Long-chain fatty acid--CoA ligase n=1 Tax=Pseudonocardia oceani TaxID=2792013 RepID=A0ABS6UEL3_9PSEU|nr:long-chain fatty acid--CoA ligase [Pseudonocardia oceani]MBW0092627.1 long-chain fatty acid--CoA ligase [Pseudonocardia oceani]MBW0100387.1 long-chain fatty acid--CoA ligase [Pseudonocardia oceani]MBW0113050.1 long-chain fatty acid--CoA ligase [Pseudonocardia oceani]MBW0121677.1 long-chain fatty acid--CoA ligase [Pseudonocardia oceani]MBW0130639.1 long-chain fatty acid--CoA ligase [Pseudonocardia oceani]
MHITQALHRAVQQAPDLPATVFGERTRTWAECADRVARLAAALRGLGVASGDRVGILALNSDRYHEYLLAVPWADAVLNPANVRWSAAEIAYSLADSGTRVLLVDDAFAPMLPALRAAHPDLGTVIHCGEAPAPDGMLSYEELVAAHEPVEDAFRGGEALAGIFYTGGTTGSPKGVMLSHDNMIISALGTTASGNFMTPGGRTLHAAPMFHLADLAAWTARCLVGGTHVIVPAFEPAAVAAAVETHRADDALLVPLMIQVLADSPVVRAADLSSMRRVLYGASPISEAVLDRAAKILPTAEFTQAYGMTELSPVATLLDPADHAHPTRRRSAGRAAPHSLVRIVDVDDVEVPRGTVGEVVVRGGHVMLGYWNRPEETAAALRGGWMHTGDGAYMDEDGYVFVVDRLKDMIVSGGENVYSAEVENALARHPAVASCAVIGVPDDEWGERVHAVVVLQPGAGSSAAELREHAKTLIAGYKAPRTVEFVDALPVSGAGKILKRELRARYWADADRQVH